MKLGVNNLISPQLTLLAKEFEKLELLTDSLRKSLGKIEIDSAGFKALASSANATNKAFEKASISAASFHSQLSKIKATGVGMTLPGGGRPSGGGGQGGRGPGGMHGGNIHMGPGGVGMGTVGMAAGDWFLPLAASVAAYSGGHALYESAKDLNTEQNKLRLFGLTDAQNQSAFNFVRGMRQYGTTQAQNQASFNEAQGVGRESGLEGDEALAFAKLGAPILAKMDALGIGLGDEAKGSLHASNVAFLRFAEQSGGARDPQSLNRLANMAYKLKQSSGDTVDFEQLRAMTSRGGMYTQNMSDEGYAESEPLIAEMKGGAYGDALATMGGRLTGTTKPTKAMLNDLLKLGIWDRSKIVFNAQGGEDHFLGNPLGEKNTELLKSNFPEFYRTVLRPAYVKAKYSDSDIGRENIMLLGRQGGKAGNNAEKNLPLMDNALTAFRRARDLDSAGNILQKSLGGQEAEFTAAWTDFKTEFGTKMLPFFTGILKAGSAILRYFPDDKSQMDQQGSAQSSIQSMIKSWWDSSGSSSPVKGGAVAGKVDRTQKQTVNLMVDKTKLGSVTLGWMDKQLKQSQTGGTSTDFSWMPTPAGVVTQ